MNRSKPSPVPALVVGRGYTGLGTLRSLALAGIPAYVACPRDDLVTASRWYRPPPGLEDWDGSVDGQSIELLRDLQLETAVLIACRDDAALWMSDVAEHELASRFRTCSSSRATLELLQDKGRFGQLLRRSGIPHPRTFSIRSRADINKIPFEDLDRVFLKPTDSQRFNQLLGTKGFWAASRGEFHEIWNQIDKQGLSVVAQEYVRGGADDHYFVDGFRDRRGKFTGLFARRRLRIYPPDFGNSSYCLSVPLREVAEAIGHLTWLLSDLDYRGIFSAEFKRDARNGEFRILEVNTRAWWYVEFAARCGVNVCQMAYQDAMHLPVTQSVRNYRLGAGCVNLGADLKSVLSSRTRGPLYKYLWQWSRAHYHVMLWNDPAPALKLSAAWLHRVYSRAIRISLSVFGRSRYTEADSPRSPVASSPPGNQ